MDLILKSEIKLAIDQSGLYTGSTNGNLIKKTFPKLFTSTLKATISEFARDMDDDMRLLSDDSLLRTNESLDFS